jgi:DNA-directed RNA polymerase specialized sigma24 family protein
MGNSRPGSVTKWLSELKEGDEQAAQALWNRYFSQLVELANRRLKRYDREADGEDIALCAMKSFCLGARQQRFPSLTDRDGLWPLLVTITARKTSNEVKRQRAKKRDAAANEHVVDLNLLLGNEPSPDFAALVADETNSLLRALDDDVLQTIARRKLEGYTNEEIAEEFEVSTRTVVRKLARIRQEWEAVGSHA